MNASPLSRFGRALVTAFLFLTRLPMPRLRHYEAADSGRALPLFPLVGLVIGGLLALVALILQNWLPATVLAGLVLTLWVLITGGLHLDGLGDSADGWLAGGDAERTLTIMKDPHSGSAAVVIIGCLLLLKFAALSALLAHSDWWVLCLAPLLARAMALLLLLSTPYVSRHGIAEDFLQHASRAQLWLAVALAWLLTLVLLPVTQALLVMVLTGLVLAGLRALMLRRLGGATGDTSGATIEITEAMVLVACTVLW